MPKVNVVLYGREYQLACAEGQERRVLELAAFVEQRLHAAAAQVGNTTENRLFMLTCMMMADEFFELRDTRRPSPAMIAAATANDEEMLLNAIAHMQHRLDHLTDMVGSA